LSLVFRHDQASGDAVFKPDDEFECGSAAGLAASGWGWREIVAQTAHRTGVLKYVGHVSQKYELRLKAGKLLPALRRVSHSKYAILCYHRVGTEGIPYYSTMPTRQFEMQMQFLRENFRVLSLRQLCDELRNPAGCGRGVAVTFDDGYSDLFTQALPVLRKYEIPATVYLTAGCIETGEVAWYDRIFLALQVAPGPAIEVPIKGGLRFLLGSPQQRVEIGAQIVSILRRTAVPEQRHFCAALEQQLSLPLDKLTHRMLSWAQVREMRSAGIFFGSHTLSHPVLSQLDIADIEKELRESKSILETRLGEPVLDFAFPFGKAEDCGPIARAAVARCGYRSAVTTVWGINTPGADMHSLKRLRLGDERTVAKFGLQLHREFFRVSESSGTSVPLSENANGLHEEPAIVKPR
jgi:peptidoglycan/xylan/chitin deacetylase (PgdA/CDA1 family)